MKQAEGIIVADSLKKSYKDLHVLKGISFAVTKGSIFALLGSNGAGKTTTVKLLSTLIKPDGGNATICGFHTVTQGHKVREHISLTGQYAAVDELLTGRENLRMIGALHHLKDKNRRTEELIEKFRLEEPAGRRVSAYSGGTRRRLDLAMSLMGNPSVIFLDEPTTGLDPQSRYSMWEIIKSLAGDGTTIFLTTQYLEEAEQLASHIAILHKGIIAEEGTPDQLKGKLSQGTIELTFSDGLKMEQTYQLLEHYKVRKDPEMLKINIYTDGSVKQLAGIMNLLNEADTPITGFIQKLPTLEDVFLNLIGENEGKKDQ